MNKNKIAILVACVCGPDTGNETAHIRYQSWEKRVRTGETDHRDRHIYRSYSNIILRYNDTTIEQVLSQMSIGFMCRQFVQHRSLMGAEVGGIVRQFITASTTSEGYLQAIFLGMHEGQECYLVMIDQNDTTGRFSVKEVPKYGRASVVYAHDTARGCFDSPGDNTIFSDGSPPKEMCALFDFMHERIVPHMQSAIDNYRQE